MKKKLDEQSRKIRHSRKKHNGMFHKTNALGKAIKGLKSPTSERDLKPQTRPTPEPEWNFKELERAFRGAYRSYRIRGCPRMDAETFFQ